MPTEAPTQCPTGHHTAFSIVPTASPHLTRSWHSAPQTGAWAAEEQMEDAEVEPLLDETLERFPKLQPKLVRVDSIRSRSDSQMCYGILHGQFLAIVPHHSESLA